MRAPLELTVSGGASAVIRAAGEDLALVRFGAVFTRSGSVRLRVLAPGERAW